MLRRGSVYLLKQNDALKVKPRPVVVISRDELNRGHSVTIVPFYSQQLDKRKSTDYCVGFYPGEAGLDKECVAKADEIGQFPISGIDTVRGPIGELPESRLQDIIDAVKWCLKDGLAH